METLGLGLFGLVLLGLVGTLAIWIMSLRTIVAPNDVHIITQGKNVKSYGKSTPNGNVYYKWPAFLPAIGLSVEVLPVSNFEMKLRNYEGYDKGRVPFVVDITAFFRIRDTNLAAERVENFDVLKEQLEEIVRGAVRNILAQWDIDRIMEERSELGKAFTDAIGDDLEEWGVETTKNVEFMDIRDAAEEKVIYNIMEKKRSLIERESREEVAENMRAAEEKEISARQSVEIRDQEAMQAVGERTAEKEKQVGIANELAKQEIKEQERETKEKEMAVIKVQEVRKQEIIKEQQIVKAQEDKETIIIRAEANKEQDIIKSEGDKQQQVLVSEGFRTSEENKAAGIEAVGRAQGIALTEKEMAPVNAQIALAQEIGENQGYQEYLEKIRNIEASQAIGVEQAKALVSADVKVIANTGNVTEGASNVMELFTPKGGTSLAGAMEALNQSDLGRAVLEKLGVTQSPANTPEEPKPAVATTSSTPRRKKTS